MTNTKTTIALPRSERHPGESDSAWIERIASRLESGRGCFVRNEDEAAADVIFALARRRVGFDVLPKERDGVVYWVLLPERGGGGAE